MVQMEGGTVEEKLEDQVLTGFLVMKSFLRTKKEDALAALASSGLPSHDLPKAEKVLVEIYDGIKRA
jgi:hypothetical protein